MTKNEVVNRVADAYAALADLDIKVKSILEDIESINIMLEEIPDDPSEITDDKVN